MVDSLAGMPGRKAVLYVSDGLQMIAGQDVFYAVQSKYDEQSSSTDDDAPSTTSPAASSELTAQANANRVTFYTIDAARPAHLRLDLGREPGAGRRRPGMSS